MTLQDHVIKALNDFMVTSPTRYVAILAILAATVIMDVDSFNLSRDVTRSRNQKVMCLYR